MNFHLARVYNQEPLGTARNFISKQQVSPYRSSRLDVNH